MPGKITFCFQILIIFFCTFLDIRADLKIYLYEKDRQSLTEFFHAILWGSEVGYVLYGQKPVCVEPYFLTQSDITGKIMHRLSTSISQGVKVWKELSLPFETSKFIFLIKENLNKDGDLNSAIIFINKEAFSNAFYENSSLFHYVLGPEVTKNKLLQEINKTQKNFFSFLKNDKVLIGILLGFGLESSLYVSRSEQIQEALDVKKNYIYFDPLNFKAKNDKKFFLPIKSFPTQPSLGYSSLEKELDNLNNRIDIASMALEYYSPKLIFGKIKNCNKSSSKLLIKNYKETQLKIIEVLDQSDWLEQILSQFYGEPVKIYTKKQEPDKNTENLYDASINLSNVIAEAIFNRFNDEFQNKNKILEFIEGMKEAEKRSDAHYINPFFYTGEDSLSSNDHAFLTGFKIWSYYKFNENIIYLPSIINYLKERLKEKSISISSNNTSPILSNIYKQIFNNINCHEENLALAHFEYLKKEKKIKTECLVKDRLYYQQISAGTGNLVLKNQIVQVSYILKTIHGNIIEDRKEGSFLDLRRAIRGFRAGFPSMKIGEKGVLFIHPEWGIKDYLSYPHFSPYLIAEFTLQESINEPAEDSDL